MVRATTEGQDYTMGLVARGERVCVCMSEGEKV